MRQLPIVTVKLEKIVGGGQTIATMSDGRKLFVWGGLPGETVKVQLTKKKNKLAEGIVTEVIQASPERIQPKDSDSYLSTSPWQIMTFESEQAAKADLIQDAFRLQKLEPPKVIDIFSDQNIYHYRNKVEFSWYWDNDKKQLELSFFKRGSHGKMPVDHTSLARPEINQAAQKIRDLLRIKKIEARELKTIILRSNHNGEVVAQLYVMDEDFPIFSSEDFKKLEIQGFETIFSNPKSPASVITKRLQKYGDMTLIDEVLGIDFSYSAEGFFQINLPAYEQALKDMKAWINDKPVVDYYSGVGTIGLTIGGDGLKLIEINPSAVEEMERNIQILKSPAEAILSPAENTLEHIKEDSIVILDPPRAGLHDGMIQKILEVQPQRILYLSCNPVTQIRDFAKLSTKYKIDYQRGYNFFPRTPHIEFLIVLDRK